MVGLLWLIFAILLVLSLVGFAVNWGAFIWILLLAGLLILVFNIAGVGRTGRWY